MSIISYLECQAECRYMIFFYCYMQGFLQAWGGGGTLFGDSKCVQNRCCADNIFLGGSGGMPSSPEIWWGKKTAALRSNVVGFGS